MCTVAQVVLYSQIETLPGIGEVDVDVAADVGVYRGTGTTHPQLVYTGYCITGVVIIHTYSCTCN